MTLQHSWDSHVAPHYSSWEDHSSKCVMIPWAMNIFMVILLLVLWPVRLFWMKFQVPPYISYILENYSDFEKPIEEVVTKFITMRACWNLNESLLFKVWSCIFKTFVDKTRDTHIFWCLWNFVLVETFVLIVSSKCSKKHGGLKLTLGGRHKYWLNFTLEINACIRVTMNNHQLPFFK